jgi:hypothetical protein
MTPEIAAAIERMRLAVAGYVFATLHVRPTDYAHWRHVNIELQNASDALVALRDNVKA